MKLRLRRNEQELKVRYRHIWKITKKEHENSKFNLGRLQVDVLILYATLQNKK